MVMNFNIKFMFQNYNHLFYTPKGSVYPSKNVQRLEIYTCIWFIELIDFISQKELYKQIDQVRELKT